MLLTKAELSKLLAVLYDAAGDSALWPAFLQELGRATRSNPSAILMHDLGHGEHGISLQWGVETCAMRSYRDYFGTRDIWLQKAAPMTQKGWLGISEEVCSSEELRRSEFYNDYLRPNNMAQAMWGVLEKSPSRIINVGLYRDLRRPFGKKEMDLLRLLAPHIIRAFQLHLHISDLKTRAGGLQQAIDTVMTGIILLGERGRVIHANRKAAQLLGENDGLKVFHGCLDADRSDEASALGRLVTQAIETAMGSGVDPGGAVQISRRARPALQVLITPTRNVNFDPAVIVRAIAFVTDPSQKVRPGIEVLQALFKLTPAESRIALLLSDGHAPPDIAELIAVSANTVKSQLKSIYSKTGVSRQSQLVRLLTQLTLVQPPK
jgi:DNA-binding CsgD family transcriptional regulator/PAS domain-containing protein